METAGRAPYLPWLLTILAIFTTLFQSSLCEGKLNLREKEREILDEILSPSRYDARIRPSAINGTDGPVIVHVNTFVRSISNIDDVSMEYDAQLTFREEWVDERLKYDDLDGRLKYLTLTESSRVWMPDVFFSNEKEGHFHNIVMPNTYIRIFPNGHILYSVRISLTLNCPMNLKLFPFDKQVCTIRMASYGWTIDDLVLLWKEGDPVQLVKNLQLPKFEIEKFKTDYCNSKTNTGEYSCLKVDFLINRVFSYYFVQIYIPYCMLVIVSWLTFWLDQKAVFARITLGIMTLLTMSTQTSGINASLPSVSYTKAIDVWTGVCLTFVFAALVECALVNYVGSDKSSKNNNKKRTNTGNEGKGPNLMDSENNTFAMKSLHQPVDDMLNLGDGHITSNSSAIANRIDVISRIAFPLAFTLFSLVYWKAYLSEEE